MSLSEETKHAVCLIKKERISLRMKEIVCESWRRNETCVVSLIKKIIIINRCLRMKESGCFNKEAKKCLIKVT